MSSSCRARRSVEVSSRKLLYIQLVLCASLAFLFVDWKHLSRRPTEVGSVSRENIPSSIWLLFRQVELGRGKLYHNLLLCTTWGNSVSRLFLGRLYQVLSRRICQTVKRVGSGRQFPFTIKRVQHFLRGRRHRSHTWSNTSVTNELEGTAT